MIKAYAALKPGESLVPFEYEPGPLGHQEVEIQVEYCGLCHSDLSMINNDWGVTRYPLVPGHEVIGKIINLGSEVTHLKRGQRVGLGWHAGYCMTCSCCMSGDHNLCAKATSTIVGHHGGFADKVRAQATSVVVLPDSLKPESAGPLFCGGVTVFNPLLQFGVRPTDKVGVIGIGGLGHMALGFMKAWGCEVTAFTSTPQKRAEAQALGAHYTLNSTNREELEAAAGSFDFILSTVNVKLNWNTYMATLKPKGRLHFVGATLEPLDLSAFGLIGAQKSVSGSPVGSPATIATMLEFAATHHLEPQVEVFPLSQVNEAIAHLESGKARYRVVLKA